MTTRFCSIVLPACFVLVFLSGASPLLAQRQPPKTREQIISDAVTYLKKSQAEDGTWSSTAHVGITGMVTAALLRGGSVPADDPQVAKALALIESMKSDETGNLAADPKVFHKNYVTSVNLGALHRCEARETSSAHRESR